MSYDAIFMLCSDAKLLSDLSEQALCAAREGNPERAREALLEAKRRYEDMVGLRVRLEDALRSVPDAGDRSL